MDGLSIQTRLKNAGFDPGPLDGSFGPNSYNALLTYTVGHAFTISTTLARAMAADFPRYDISTPLRIAHFVAQAAHETMYFRYLTELGSGRDANHNGYDDYFEKYDFRSDLGDNAVGMGQKYCGRGLFQITGYFNYLTYGKRLGIDLVNNPTRAADPDIATLTACLYWSDRKLSALADQDNVSAITKKINGGYNGLDDRTAILNKIKKIVY